MSRGNIKREIDLQTMVPWIEPGSRVLDLGCGRGVFLEHLQQTRNVYGVGVDRSPEKIASCIKRGVNAYQGSVDEALEVYPEGSFDWVICSRMLHEIDEPQNILNGALRVSKQVAVGFVNFGFWETRWSILASGQRPRNEVYPYLWHDSHTSNPLTIKDFEHFCSVHDYRILHRVFLDASWRKPIKHLSNLLAGYAIYAITR